jgi:hypothetical protein
MEKRLPYVAINPNFNTTTGMECQMEFDATRLPCCLAFSEEKEMSITQNVSNLCWLRGFAIVGGFLPRDKFYLDLWIGCPRRMNDFCLVES